MYIYRVRNLSTNEFYFGVSTENKRKFSPIHNLDPMNIFGESKYIEKRLITEIQSDEELQEYIKKYTEAYKTDTNFLGIKLDTNNTSEVLKVYTNSTSTNIVTQPKEIITTERPTSIKNSSIDVPDKKIQEIVGKEKSELKSNLDSKTEYNLNKPNKK